MKPKTIIDLFYDPIVTRARTDAILYKKNDLYCSFSSESVRLQTEWLASGLVKVGLEPGDRVALLSENRPEWLFSDIAILLCQAINVPLYPTLPATQLEELLNDCKAKFIIVSTIEQLNKVKQIQDNLPFLKMKIVMDLKSSESENLRNLDDLFRIGKDSNVCQINQTNKIRSGIKKDDIATIIYTSGTTGPPKGVMLSHSNIVSNVLASSKVLKFDRDDRVLSFLPLSHIFERMFDYLIFFKGVSLAYAENIESVPKNMFEVQPTVVACVPRFFEKLHDRILETRQNNTGFKRMIAEWAFKVGSDHAYLFLQNNRINKFLSIKYWLATKIVFSKLKNKLGGRVRYFISGGAPLDKHLAEFFFSIGFLILEGYGLTETSPVISVNRPDKFKFGTVGLPLSELKVKISDDGEILTKGPSVMYGYYKKERETQEVLQDGWLHTGDIGSLDQDGFLIITDRKKDLIVTAGGKKVAPQRLEMLLKSNPIFKNAIVVGDKKPFISGIVVPNAEMVTTYAKNNNVNFSTYSELVRSPIIQKFLLGEVEQSTKELASFEKLKAIIVSERDFSLDLGEITPTLKVRRGVVEKKFRKEIEAIYAVKDIS